jgi:phosphate transport system permease protein
MVYATALLLLVIVVLLNLTAIIVRNRLRRRYSIAAF